MSESWHLLCWIRELAAEEDEEEDEGIASDQNPSSNTVDIAEVPKEIAGEEKEEDELAEYELDKYDQEDTGEGKFQNIYSVLLLGFTSV